MMKHITFPEDEESKIEQNLRDNGEVWTIRVSKEYGKYHLGEILGSIFGNLVVEKIFKIDGGIDELREKYIYFSEIEQSDVKVLERYEKMNVICLRKI